MCHAEHWSYDADCCVGLIKWVHSTPYCFLPIVSIRRLIGLFNVLGVSSTRYTMKSSPKNFAVLCILLFLRASLLSFSECSTCVCSRFSIGSIEILFSIISYLDKHVPSFIGKIFSKKVISLDFIIVRTCSPEFTIRNL